MVLGAGLARVWAVPPLSSQSHKMRTFDHPLLFICHAPLLILAHRIFGSETCKVRLRL